MGLLSSTGDRDSNRLFDFLSGWCSFLCVAAAVAALGGHFMIIWPTFNLKTYISENALLPGLVHEEFEDGIGLRQCLDRLQTAVERSNGSLPADHLMKELADANLEASTQDFTVHHVLKDDVERGKNVYGIVRAPRGASAEGVAIVVPFSPDNLPALAVGLQLVKSVKDKVYWAKDIVILFADKGTVGTQAWLSAYHGIRNDRLDGEMLEYHVGALQAAIGLEWHDTQATHVDIAYHGVNGQLPNLDLINMAERVMEKQGLQPTLQGREDPDDIMYGDFFSMRIYKQYLRTGYKALWQQAASRPTGYHGVFGQYGIEALTLRPWRPWRSRQTVGMDEVARVIEGMLRSVNNLLERFHQSYFFYLLLSTKRFVSIAYYMPPIVLLLMVPLVMIPSVLLLLPPPSTKRFVSIAYYMPPIVLLLMVPLVMACKVWSRISTNLSELNKENEEQPERLGIGSVMTALPVFLISHLMGIFAYYMPSLLTMYYRREKSLTDRNIILQGLVAVLLAQITLPLFRLNRRCSDSAKNLIKCMALLELSLVVGVVSILNFALGLLVAVCYSPSFTFVCSTDNRIVKWFNRLLMLLLHPVVLSVILVTSVSVTSQTKSPLVRDIGSGQILWDAVFTSIEQVSEFVLQTMNAMYWYNCWLFPYVCLVIVSVWNLFWTIALM